MERSSRPLRDCSSASSYFGCTDTRDGTARQSVRAWPWTTDLRRSLGNFGTKSEVDLRKQRTGILDS